MAHIIPHNCSATSCSSTMRATLWSKGRMNVLLELKGTMTRQAYAQNTTPSQCRCGTQFTVLTGLTARSSKSICIEMPIGIMTWPTASNVQMLMVKHSRIHGLIG